jgi:hypothetical protein
MKFDALLHKLADKHAWTLLYLRDEDSYRIQVATPGDRRQDVFITFRQDDQEAWMATIWSVIAKVEDFNLEDPVELLRFNWRQIWGHLAVRKDEVVLAHDQLTDEANWNEVAKAVQAIAVTSDGIEAMIYGDEDTN